MVVSWSVLFYEGVVMIDIEQVRQDPKGYAIRLMSGRIFPLKDWWIVPFGAPEEGYLLDDGSWGGSAIQFKCGEDGTFLVKTQEGWKKFGTFESVDGHSSVLKD